MNRRTLYLIFATLTGVSIVVLALNLHYRFIPNPEKRYLLLIVVCFAILTRRHKD